jgi:hypothetical protein
LSYSLNPFNSAIFLRGLPTDLDQQRGVILKIVASSGTAQGDDNSSSVFSGSCFIEILRANNIIPN